VDAVTFHAAMKSGREKVAGGEGNLVSGQTALAGKRNRGKGDLGKGNSNEGY